MKERVKSFVLVTLVIFTLVLAERILVDEKLWPTGYNFFSIRTTPKKNEVSVSENLITPERIIINTGYQSSRFEYLKNSSEFEEVHETSKKILKEAFQKPSKDISTIPADSWYSILTAKSVYLPYPCAYSAQNFAQFLGLSSTDASFKSFSDIVISNSGSVYINDSDNFYKIDTGILDLAEMIETAANSDTGNQSVINYSFDLNFDKAFGSEKTILSPMIPIYSDSLSANILVASNPITKDGEPNQKTINAILTAFSVNPNSTWRYTEADGTLVFVENNGVLKITPDGILTFTASDTGILLTQNPFADNFEIVTKVASFIDNINSALDYNIQMSPSSPITADNVRTFTFDYNISGIPVKYKNQNAVTVTVSGGYITEYSQILRVYDATGYTGDIPLYIHALDNIILKYQDSMNQIDIKKMFPAYIDDLNLGEKTPDWFIEIDNVIAE